MEPLYEEYLTPGGTIVKPYYWLSFSLDCTNCPYHIRTGEEARVPYTEFHQIFGFPWSTYPQRKQLTFYELKTSSGNLIQKGHASNCTGSHTHPESMLFEMNGYLDSAIYNNSSIRHIILYSNNSPCNEANHCCITKMYNFLMVYPEITLSIFFSKLYHTEHQFPSSAWNREALRSLASLQPRVTLSPISGGIWHSLLANFVRGISGSTIFCPILAERALTDRYNAYEINSITGVKPYFIDILQTQPKGNQRIKAQTAFEDYLSNNTVPGQSSQATSRQLQLDLTPDPSIPVVFVLVPYRDLPPIHVDQNLYKPRTVVRHLNMPQLSSYKTKELGKPPMSRPVETVEPTEWSASSKEADKKNKKKWTN